MPCRTVGEQIEACEEDIRLIPSLNEIKDKITIIPMSSRLHNIKKLEIDISNRTEKNEKLQIVIHHTACETNKECIEYFSGSENISAHFLVQDPEEKPFSVVVEEVEYRINPKDTPYIMFVPLDDIAFHVATRRKEDCDRKANDGISNYTLNYSTIGVEVTNVGARYLYDSTTGKFIDTSKDNQIQKLVDELICALYPVLNKDEKKEYLPVITHAVADPKRKHDINSGIYSIPKIYEKLSASYPNDKNLAKLKNIFCVIDSSFEKNIDFKACLEKVGYSVGIDENVSIPYSFNKEQYVVPYDRVISSLNMFVDDCYTTKMRPCFTLENGKNIIVTNIPNMTDSHDIVVPNFDSLITMDFNNLDVSELVKDIYGIEGIDIEILAVDRGHLRIKGKTEEGLNFDEYVPSTELSNLVSETICKIEKISKERLSII